MNKEIFKKIVEYIIWLYKFIFWIFFIVATNLWAFEWWQKLMYSELDIIVWSLLFLPISLILIYDI